MVVTNSDEASLDKSIDNQTVIYETQLKLHKERSGKFLIKYFELEYFIENFAAKPTTSFSNFTFVRSKI